MTTFARRYGPWAVVAGASEGLGAAFAHALARRGVHVALVARRAEKLAEVRAAIARASPVQVRELVLDLAEPGAAEQAARALADVEVGLCVYNAALSPHGAFLAQPLEENLRAVDVNVRGPLAFAHHFGKPMAARGRGALLFLSSLTAFQGSPLLATYGATKSFNLAFAEALWDELRGQGVDVLAVCAGATRTPNFLKAASTAPGLLEPEQVAEEALGRLGAPLMIPGRFNRLASFFMRRVLPRRTAIALMGAQARKLRLPP